MTLPGFTPCPCNGKPYFIGGSEEPCPSCGGAGQVPDDDTVNRKAAELHDAECVGDCDRSIDNWKDYARTRLLAYARHTQETK